jgi:two-component system, chemotaxis family, sensor kinase CheA
MDQTQNEFLAEIAERIEQLFVAIDELRRKLGNGPERRELLDRIFRITHSIKGSAASIGLTALNKEAHAFESLLGSVRSGETALDEQLVDNFEDVAQALLDSLTPSASEYPQAQSLEQLMNLLPLGLRESVGITEQAKLLAAYQEGANIYVIAASYELNEFDSKLRQLQERLKRRGEIVATSSTVSGESGKISFQIIFPSQAEVSNLVADLDDPTEISITRVAQRAPVQKSVLKAAEPLSKLVHVNLNDLDRLSSTAHKLLTQTTSTLEQAFADTTRTSNDLEASLISVRQSFMALEEEIIHLRAVSLERAIQRAVRAGRAVARASGKDVAFDFSGGDIRLDKLLANAIGDSLIHLVRNAVDHGIETGPERTLLGKTLQGRVRLEVTNESGRTLVRVSDDGRGIDPLIISRAAAELGIIPRGTTVTLERSLRLIFRPGFSTVALVSGVSGRGVGLDVVETLVEHSGGEVRVSSEVGKGTAFEIRLPVTFGLLNSRVVKSADYLYCLDANIVRRCAQISENEIELSHEGPICRLDNELLPIFYLRRLLGQSVEDGDSGQKLTLLLCEFSGVDDSQKIPKRMGLMVDCLVSEEEVLVRGLGPHGGRWYGVAGAAELIDGTVALVLDLPRLMQSIAQ